MKVMTYNIWNYSKPWMKRRELIASIIKTHAPDAVALQETRHDWRFERGRGQGEQLAELTGYHATSQVAQVYVPILRVDEGLTILTREPPVRIMKRVLTQNPRDRADENRRVCLGVAVREQTGRELHVYDAHFSLSEEARKTNAVEVAAFIADQSGSTPAVLMGDLNAEPHTTPIRFLVGEETIDGSTGDFGDCWLQSGAPGPGYTYASFDPVRRIDYILARNLAGPPNHCEIVGGEPVDGVYASDHMGIVASIDL